MKHIVIGNGTSRLDYDIDKIEGIKYGCNAIYRDHMTDYLICKDKNMCDEILGSGCWKDRTVIMQTRWRNDSEIQEAYKKIMWWRDIIGTNDYTDCGSVALWIAAKHASQFGDNVVAMYGMDFDDPNSNKINNVYNGSPNYSGRLNQRRGVTKEFLDTIDEYPDVKFVHMNSKFPELLEAKENVTWNTI